jgi:hypothetical protein
MGAIDEWIAESSIRRIEQFLEAVFTDGHIRRNQGGAIEFRGAGKDRKIIEVADPIRRFDKFRDMGQRRKIGRQFSTESLDISPAAFDMDDNTGGRVRNVPRDPMYAGQLIDMGSETDPLNDSVDVQPEGNDFIRRHIIAEPKGCL